jgi:hypothetical protein
VNPFRALLAVGLGVLALLAFANLALWHSAAWFPIGFYATILALGVAFEAGRYRPNHAGVRNSAWQATGERFFDPTTGTPTEVFYDPQSGARDYRSR